MNIEWEYSYTSQNLRFEKDKRPSFFRVIKNKNSIKPGEPDDDLSGCDFRGQILKSGGRGNTVI